MRVPGRPPLLLVASAALVIAACGTAASPTRRPELRWERASIALPPDVVQVAPGTSPGIHCAPCHAVQASLLAGVIETPDGLLAFGQQLPPPEAIAYRTADGRAWAPEPGFPVDEGTVATGGTAHGGRVVLVGTRGRAGATWVRDVAGGWSSAGDGLEQPPGGEVQVRTVAATPGGLVAGGRVDAADGTRSVAIWTSTDGTAWQRVGDVPDAAGGVALGSATGGDTTVVVGYAAAGDSREPVAWTDAGDGWTASRPPHADGGVMSAVTWTGSGFVAVGYTDAEHRGLAWTSPDGATWTAVPDQDAFENRGDPVRLTALVAAPGGGLLAGGWVSDAGNGSGALWRSTDGVTWERPPAQAGMSGGSVAGVAAIGGIPVAVGTSGSPDNDQASAWYELP